MMLDAIVDKGQAQLDSFFEVEIDREALYNRFAA
jgi:hypothetical protein